MRRGSPSSHVAGIPGRLRCVVGARIPAIDEGRPVVASLQALTHAGISATPNNGSVSNPLAGLLLLGLFLVVVAVNELLAWLIWTKLIWPRTGWPAVKRLRHLYGKGSRRGARRCGTACLMFPLEQRKGWLAGAFTVTMRANAVGLHLRIGLLIPWRLQYVPKSALLRPREVEPQDWVWRYALWSHNLFRRTPDTLVDIDVADSHIVLRLYGSTWKRVQEALGDTECA